MLGEFYFAFRTHQYYAKMKLIWALLSRTCDVILTALALQNEGWSKWGWFKLLFYTKILTRWRSCSPSSMLEWSHVYKRTWMHRKHLEPRAREAHHQQHLVQTVWEGYPRHVKMKRCAQFAYWKWWKGKVWQVAKMVAITDFISIVWKYVSWAQIVKLIKWMYRFTSFQHCIKAKIKTAHWNLHMEGQWTKFC